MMKHIMSNKTKSELTNVVAKDVQPNAVDLRLDKVFRIHDSPFLIDDQTKKHRGSTEIHPDSNGYFTLDPNTYEILFTNQIYVGEGEAGFVITRSTLNRNGIFITSGLYDSGYRGVMVAAMHVNCGVAIIKKGTRVAQYLTFDSENLHLYDGDYGDGKSHDKKYLS